MVSLLHMGKLNFHFTKICINIEEHVLWKFRYMSIVPFLKELVQIIPCLPILTWGILPGWQSNSRRCAWVYRHFILSIMDMGIFGTRADVIIHWVLWLELSPLYSIQDLSVIASNSLRTNWQTSFASSYFFYIKKRKIIWFFVWISCTTTAFLKYNNKF